jgi:hypothetical protein
MSLTEIIALNYTVEFLRALAGWRAKVKSRFAIGQAALRWRAPPPESCLISRKEELKLEIARDMHELGMKGFFPLHIRRPL